MKKDVKTEILNQDIESIRRACNHLRRNELVSFPTETVYGLGASAISNIAVAKIFAVKGRPKYNPLIVHISDKEDVYQWAKVPKECEILIECFWPGPLTLVLKKRNDRNHLSSLVTGNLETVAIRLPMHETARALIKEFGNPIAAPSANISGRVSPTRAKDVINHFNGKISALIEGDNCSIGLESTIINFSEKHPVQLRSGGIPLETIEKKLGCLIPQNFGPSGKGTKIIAPGMMESHYAPVCKLKLNERKPKSGELFLGFGAMPENALGLNLSLNGDLKEAANNFFSSLNDIDEMAKMMGINTVSVAPIPNSGLGITLNDRLKRAATPKI